MDFDLIGPELTLMLMLAIVFIAVALIAVAVFVVFKLKPIAARVGSANLITKVAAPLALVGLLSISIIITAAINVPIARRMINDSLIGWAEPELTSERGAVTAEGDELAELIELEGAVLAKNDGLLPLKSSEVKKLNVFGWSSCSWVVSGSGSGRTKQPRIGNSLPNPEAPYTGTPRWSNYSAFSFYAEIDFYGALTKYGIEYNDPLKQFYLNAAPGKTLNNNVGTRPYFGVSGTSGGTLHSYDFQYSRLIEPAVSSYGTLFDDAKDFSDYAVVVISRVSGESNDSPKYQYKGNYNSTNRPAPDDASRHYLEISTEEEALLTRVGKDYPGKTLVLVNSTNTMELGFMDTIPGLAACLIVGTTGPRAATAIPKLLFDEVTYLKQVEGWTGTTNSAARWEQVTEPGVSPSGRLSDIYAYDLKTNPTWASVGHPTGSNFGQAPGDGSGQKYYDLQGNTSLPNSTTKLYPLDLSSGNFDGGTNTYAGLAYVDYMESVYVGYKWYETADKTGYWAGKTSDKAGAGKTGYDAVVQYPFGYGLGYTQFEWSVHSSTIVRNGESVMGTRLQKDDKIRVRVTVTNKGNIAAKEVVQLYVEPPYTPGGVEKSSANLVAFGKTDVIEPNKSETLILEFDAFDMASYDAYNLSGKVGTKGGYVLEYGPYDIKVMDNSHSYGKGLTKETATVTYNVDEANGIVYDKDPKTGATIENRFTGANAVDGIPVDGSKESTPIKFLKRNDFSGTFPTTQVQRSLTDAARAQNRFTHNTDYMSAWNQANQPDKEIVVGATGVDSKLGELNSGVAVPTALGLELGNPANYGSDRWNEVLSVMTAAEMRSFTLQNGTNTPAQAKLGLPEIVTMDGPNQLDSWSGSQTGTGFPSATILAQTFNVVLAYKMGLQIGNDAQAVNRPNSAWLAPGINIHRTPFGSRNYEYYSEDAFLTGIMASKAIQGARNKGIFVYIKHLALYDGDTNRDSVYTWLTEQAFREIYLKPFQIAIQKGGATGLMTAYNRVGAIWGGGSVGMNTVVRDEMGFKGSIVSDWTDRGGFMDASHSIRVGGDITMNGGTYGYAAYDAQGGAGATDQAFLAALRSANMHIAYSWANAKYTEANYDPTNDPDNSTTRITDITEPKLNFDWLSFIIVPLLYVLTVSGGLALCFFAYKDLIFKKKEA